MALNTILEIPTMRNWSGQHPKSLTEHIGFSHIGQNQVSEWSADDLHISILQVMNGTYAIISAN